ncbi:MAG: magnesium/cobalt transporter CorA [Candidatus Micrarchaeota archaeon]
MGSRVARESQKAGLPPGTPVYVGARAEQKSLITAINFSQDKATFFESVGVEKLAQLAAFSGTTWINVDGISDVETIQAIGASFKLHPLMIEDILNSSLRPKYEEYDDAFFMVAKMLSFDPKTNKLESEQLSLVVSGNCLLSFQERPGDIFNGLRSGILNGKSRALGHGPDFLAYLLLDATVDNYFAILERLGERIESVQSEAVEHPSVSTLQGIHAMRKNNNSLRRNIWPLREAVSGFQKGDRRWVSKETSVYLRDAYDHVIQALDSLESNRETVTGLLDLYLSTSSNRLNEVIKTLTVISTIFIPLTFVVGVYGMNFKFMPELGWSWAYPLLWAFMAVIAAMMILYFRRKKWL